LFYLDESGFSNRPNVQRAWAPKGQPHAADASGSHRRVNVIGALDWATGQVWHHLHEKTVNRAADRSDQRHRTAQAAHAS
jgi:hypothetical protein